MKNALLIFARQPIPGKVKTRLIPALSRHEAAQLYLCMLSDTISKTESLRTADRILFYEAGAGSEKYFRDNFPSLKLCPQQGEDLGKRMKGAFDHAFSRGFHAAAVIGTDSPDLPVEYIDESFRILENGADVVFGPAEDGGYYLVALKRTYEELFHGITWSSEGVLSQSIARTGILGLTYRTLPVWYDVDTFSDLKRRGLTDAGNCAPLTRRFIEELKLGGLNITTAPIRE